MDLLHPQMGADVVGGVPPRRNEHVVVGVWADDAAVPALQWAARAARARHVPLTALMAWELPPLPRHMPNDIRRLSNELVGDLRSSLAASVRASGIEAPDLQILQQVVRSPAVDALVAASHEAGLLVLGASPHGALMTALSISRRLAATDDCPTVLVPEPRYGLVGRSGVDIVVGVDGSAASFTALGWASNEARMRGLPLRVVAVGVAGPARDRIRAAVEHEVDAQLVEKDTGDPVDVLTAYSASSEALVLGQHGAGTLGRHLPSLGSVSRAAAAHPLCPVVIVPGSWTPAVH